MSKNKKILLVLSVLIASSAVALYFVVSGDDNSKPNLVETAEQDTEPAVKIEQINEANVIDENSESAENNPKNTNPNNDQNVDQTDVAKVIIKSYEVLGSDLRVFAGVENIVEEDGTCTFAVVDETGTVIVDTKQKGLPDFDNITCGRVSLDISKIKPGEYILEVSYNSSNYESSAQQEITL